MNKNNYKKHSRRKFIADCGKMTGIGAMSSILNMTMTNKILAAQAPGSITDYKAMVCVFLSGGADSFQMLMPGVSGFPGYTAARQHLALPMNEQIQIFDYQTGADYHLHRTMTAAAQMFNDRDLTFVANVGTLVEPMNKQQFLANSRKRPFGIASHFDQASQWQTSISDEKGGGIGWFGRIRDVINDAANNNSTINMNMSPGGGNVLQQGRSSGVFNLQGGADAMELHDQDVHIKSAINSQLEQEYSSLLQNHYNHIKKDTIEQNQALFELEQNTVINTNFPNTDLGRQMLQIAKYIKVHGVLGLNRQTFFAKFGGWDAHSGMNNSMNRKLPVLFAALSAFNTAMKEIGYHDKVVTYTASDFGRGLAGNGSGTQHGWGGNNVIMGGPINGGRMLGKGGYPDLTLGSSTDVNGRGRQLPTTSVDEFNAGLAKWFGVNNDSEMETILPNIRNFYSAGDNNYPLRNMFV